MREELKEKEAMLETANSKIKQLEADNQKAKELLDESITSLNKSVESRKQAEKELAELKKEKEQLLSDWCKKRREIDQLKESIKAVATIINAILA